MLNSASTVNAEVKRQQALSQQIAQLQTDISSGTKVHVASDDPQAAGRIAAIGRTQADQTVYASNVDRASAISSQVDTSLASVTTALTRVKELMLQASNGTMNDSDRTAAVTELQGLQQQIAGYAATTDSSGNPLFATGSPLQIPIGKGITVAAADSYDQVFGSVTLKNGSTSSVDGVIAGAISALQTSDAAARTAAAATSLDAIDAAATHVSEAQSSIGVRETRINNARDSLATTKTDLADERSGLEDTDVTAAYATLSSKMTTLSAAQSVLAQLSKLSLFDKLG